jgi:hypothetical protein
MQEVSVVSFVRSVPLSPLQANTNGSSTKGIYFSILIGFSYSKTFVNRLMLRLSLFNNVIALKK